MKTILAFALVVASVIPVQAQYYERPPGYYVPPGYYDRPPPPPPPRYYERERFGRHCEVSLRTQYGREPYVCRIIDPKPLGMECACPPPGVGPEFPRSRYIPGQTVP